MARYRLRQEEGFTLIEIMTTMAIVAILLTLSAGALRHFWFVRAFDGAENDIITQLRAIQQKVIAESYPLVYGARFPKGGGPEVRRTWGLIRFDGRDLTTTADDTCVQYSTRQFGGGVEVKPSASITDGTGFEPDAYVTSFCQANLTGATSDVRNDHFVFFFPRGNATSGRVTLRQTNLNNRSKVICVNGLTGRVARAGAGGVC